VPYLNANNFKGIMSINPDWFTKKVLINSHPEVYSYLKEENITYRDRENDEYFFYYKIIEKSKNREIVSELSKPIINDVETSEINVIINISDTINSLTYETKFNWYNNSDYLDQMFGEDGEYKLNFNEI
jgi:hypothetical protein